MSMVETKTRILDAAEGLFARQGYLGTSLRQVTGEAGANLAAVHYHFGSKETLLQSVLERRLLPLGAEREAGLNRLLVRMESGEVVEVETVLEAFIGPTMRLCESSARGAEFSLLVGRILADPGGPGQEMFAELVGPNIELLLRALQAVLPDLDSELLLWRVHFCLGAMSHSLCLGHLPGFQGLVPQSVDTQTVLGRLIPFLTSGLEAP